MNTVDRRPCAGGIVLDEARRLLVIRRGRPPAEGQWSLPGGRCEPGEPPREACAREVAEETGLRIGVLRLAGRVERSAPDGGIYVIDDYVCTPIEGRLAAGDDALDARWVNRLELADLDLAPGVWAALADWGLLPA